MAISRIAAPSSTPSVLADWQAVVAQLAALLLHGSTPVQVIGSNVVKGSVLNIGGAMYVAISDTAISGTQTDYVQITASGDAVTAAFVSSLSGVSWNSAYNGYYDESGRLYIFDEYKAFYAGLISTFHLFKEGHNADLIRNTLSVVLPNATWKQFNRSASASTALKSFSNSGYVNVAKITFKNNSNVKMTIKSFRATYLNANPNGASGVRLYNSELGVLASWSDTASYVADVSGLTVDPATEFVVYLQYLEYGASDYRGPFTVTASCGLTDKAAGISPTLFEVVAESAIDGFVTVVASY